MKSYILTVLCRRNEYSIPFYSTRDFKDFHDLKQEDLELLGVQIDWEDNERPSLCQIEGGFKEI